MSPRWTRFAWHWDRLCGDWLRPGEVEFYRSMVASGALAAEPACGSGRLLAPLAAAGVRVWGADESSAMLALARERLRRAGATAELRCQTLAGFDCPPAGVILLPLDGFRLLLSIHAQRQFLRRAAARLDPGGRLALDLTLPDAQLPNEAIAPPLEDAAGRRVDAVTRWRVGPRVTVERTTFTTDLGSGRQERVVCRDSYRNVTAEELEARLCEAGFAVEQRWADFETAPFRPGAARMVVVARREGPAPASANRRRR